MTVDQQRKVLFIAGLLAFIYLLVAFPVDRDPWPFVVLVGGMLGIPAFIRTDRKNGNHDGSTRPADPRVPENGDVGGSRGS